MKDCGIVIRQKDRNLRALLRNPDLYVTIVDSGCRPVCMSPSFCDLLGCTREEIRDLARRGGSIINQFVCPDRRKDEWAMFQLMVAGYQQNAVFNTRLITRTGSIEEIQVILTPYRRTAEPLFLAVATRAGAAPLVRDVSVRGHENMPH